MAPLVLLYLMGHAALYALVLRHRPAFGREPIILGYHLGPALATGMAMVAGRWLAPRLVTEVDIVMLIALQGIYSLSFLEVWALADGGYSLRILEAVADDGRPPDLHALEDLGMRKQQDRLAGLVRMGLVEMRGDEIGLTWGGWLAATVLHGIARLLHLRRGG